MNLPLDDHALDQLFRTARTRNGWSDQPVPEDLVRQLFSLLEWGPTASNSTPARFVWVRSPQGKQRLSDCAGDNNKAKILQAPITVIVGYDLDFPDTMPKLFPARGEALKARFRADAEATQQTAFRNGTLQGAYLIIAARALGLDCGPMSGFKNAEVDRAFFAGTQIKSNFICSIGYGTEQNLFPRSPRLSFEEAGRFA